MKARAVTVRTRAFIDALGVGLVLFGIAARARIALGSPLPSSQPWLWFPLGVVEDIAAVGLAGALVLALASVGGERSESMSRRGIGALAVAFGLLLAALGEAVLYFGHAPRRQDLEVAASASFVAITVDRSLALRALATFAVLVLVVAAASGWSRHAAGAWSTSRRLLIVGLTAAAATALPIRVHQAESARNPATAAIAFLREAGHASASRRDRETSSPGDVAVRDLARADGPGRFVEDAFPLAWAPGPRAAAAPALPAAQPRPNLVFLVMEGVRAEEVGAFGGTVPGLTPHLDRIAAEGVRVDGVLSPGTHTPEGELALWYGLLATPGTIVLTEAPGTPLTGLPELLRSAGWRDFLWIHNSDGSFFGEDRFFLRRGFRTLDARDFDAREPRTSWGFSDRALARRALEAIDRLRPPFAAMVLTISNHHPFRLPPDAGPPLAIGMPEENGLMKLPGVRSLVGRNIVPMLQTVHYTDTAVGDFFDGARTRPWFADTVFVVTSDHGLPTAPLEGRITALRLEELRHHVPLIFYAPGRLAPAVRAGPASLADVPATLLGLFGRTGPRAGVGCDLLDPSGCDPRRPVVTWNDDAQTVTLSTREATYRRALPSERGEPAEEELMERLEASGGSDLAPERLPREATLERLRRQSDVYLEDYSKVVLGGRSGLPPQRR